MKLLIFTICIFLANCALAKESRVFCRYNYNGLSKVYDPAYFDNEGNIVYAKTIEEYAKVLGPTWYGVSWCDNSTMVNSIGMYYDISSIQNKLRKRRLEDSNNNKESNENKDNNENKGNNGYIDENTVTDNPYLRGNDTISDFKNRTTTYINKIYDKLKNTQQKCIPLASVNPAYNPYHKSLIIGVDSRIPNARYVTGVVVNLPDSLGSVINSIPKGFTECAAVNNCEGCSVLCNVLISATKENQISITNSKGEVSTHTIGNIESNTDILTDEISNTIEVASTLTDGNTITHSDSNTDTSSLEVAVTLAHSNSTSESSDNGFTFNTEYSEAIIHGVTEDDTHAITNTTGSTDEINWNGYKEHSDTNEYSYLSKDDYDYHNNQYEEVNGIPYIDKDASYDNKDKNKDKKDGKNKRFVLVNSEDENINLYNNQTHLEKRIFFLAPLAPILLEFAVQQGARFLIKQGIKQIGKYVCKQVTKKLAKKSIQSAAKNVAKETGKKSKRSKSKKIDTASQAGQTAISGAQLIEESVWNEKNYDLTKEWNQKNYDQTNEWNTKNYNLTETWNQINQNFTDAWNWKNYYQTDEWNRKNYDLTKEWNQKNYDQTEKWSQRNYDQTEKWSQKNYDQTEKWSQKNFDQTEYWNSVNYEQTESWNWKNYEQTEKWNWKNFNQTDYWNKRNEQTQYNLANFNYDMQVYFTEREERASLVMALAGTRSNSHTDVEGSSNGGAKINSKEDSEYNSHSHSVMEQNETTKGYSKAYTLGHNESSSKEDSKSDTISNLLSNSYTSENGWTIEQSSSSTNSNGRTFGNSYSNSVMKELSVENAKTKSIDNAVNRISSETVTFQISQSITNQPVDGGCYSYEVTPIFLSEATVWACGVNDGLRGDHVEFYTSEFTKYQSNKFIINKTDCSYKENVQGFHILENDILKTKIDPQRGVSNFMVMGDVLKAPNPKVSEGNGINYFGSYISTLNPSNPWFFGILETGQLVICHKEFNKKHIRWYSTTTIPDTEDINAYELNVEFKIANNGHLIMTAENILDDYTIEEDDIYKVDTSQEIVIWDSLPKHLPFNVGHFGDNGYTLMIKEIDNGKSCEVILYDGLLSPVWRIKPSNSNYGADIYRGYAFPIEYNLPLKVDTAKAETNYDIHNYININVKNKYESELPFKCDIIFNENEKMVSKNGKYSFYLQPSGNLVVKENDRTMWSSDTAFVEPFESPFTLSLSPIGELILRDKHNYIVWQTINPFIITKYDGNLAEDINDNNENNNDISNFNNTDINNNKNNNDNSTFNNTEINNNNVIIDNNDDDSIGLGEIIDPYDPYDDMISDNL
jgi:hypothetical protein